MNIVEALKKLKENHRLIISCKIIKTNKYSYGDLVEIDEPNFSVEEVLSNDWEVIESD
jgi:hypothetical protein